MPYCSNCRSYVDSDAPACPQCGTRNPRYVPPVRSAPPVPASATHSEGKFAKIKKIFRTDDYTGCYQRTDIRGNALFAAMAYLGILIVVPLLAARRSKFAMFHICQGAANSVMIVVAYFVFCFLEITLPDVLLLLLFLPMLAVLLACLAFAVLGAVNAVRKKARTLPWHGRLIGAWCHKH